MDGRKLQSKKKREKNRLATIKEIETTLLEWKLHDNELSLPMVRYDQGEKIQYFQSRRVKKQNKKNRRVRNVKGKKKRDERLGDLMEGKQHGFSKKSINERGFDVPIRGALFSEAE